MSKITTYSFCESFLDRFVDDLERDYIIGEGLHPSRDNGRVVNPPMHPQNTDLSRLAIVFGGRRPALFVKQALAQRMRKSFYPPRFFSIDEFMRYVTVRHEPFEPAQDLDQCYLMYTLVKKHCPQLLARNESFAKFLPWVREILSFIEQLDLECIDNDKLKGVENNAQIGYDIPEEINRILSQITILRDQYHQYMRSAHIYTRGFQYLRASELVSSGKFEEFDEIFFANFFYLNRTEERVMQSLYAQGKARMFFQGDQRRWPVLERAAKIFDTHIKEGEKVDTPKFNLKLYCGFDVHSQVCQLREVLKNIENLDRTVVVLPNPDNIIPLLSEIGPMVEDFNISMGYPLKRSSLVTLLEQVFHAQNSRDERGYYVHDYLKVLKHPLIKNLMLHDDMQVVRVLIHKVEEVLTGIEPGTVSGSVFLQLEEVLQCVRIFESAQDTLKHMGISITVNDLTAALEEIHRYCFVFWETVNHFEDFAQRLNGFLNLLVAKSLLSNYPLNIRIASKIYDIVETLIEVDFAKEVFPREDIFKIFCSKIESEIISFIGSPLKGLQILGLFETRSLNFDNVIVLDANEGVLPRLNMREALVPRDVMISLNLDRLEQEEEIQRYGFMRLISSAKNVYLIYQENREKERSRFVEELVWEKERAQSRTGIVPVNRSGFAVQAQVTERIAKKTPQMIEFLRNYRYSASSINMYLRNPMEFYYQYVFGLREHDDLLDEPENRQIGIFLHEFLEEVFKGFVGKKPLIDKKFINYADAVLNKRFDEMFGRSKRSDLFFLKHVIDERMKRFFEVERGRCAAQVAEVLCIEKVFEDVISLPVGDVRFVYKVDRIDKLQDGTVILLDYKSGALDVIPGKLEDVAAFQSSREDIFETVKSFQLPLYFHYMLKSFPSQRINAGLYNLRSCQIKEFLGRRTGFDRQKIDEVFLEALNTVMAEILNPDIPFEESK